MVKQGTTDDGARHGHGRAEVTITAVSTVAPELPVQEHRLPVSNLDLMLPPMDVCAFFCYKDSGGRGHNLAAVLKEALAKTLVAYYPLAGEVVANAAGEPEMLCSSRGVDVAEATADGTVLRDLRLGLPDESFEPFVPKKKADAVMAVQVTKFKCGGVVVGSTFDHRVCDAYSINMFLVAWAAAARGSSVPPAPSFDRSFLAPREPLSTVAGNLADRLNIPMSRVSAFPDAAVANRIFRVSGADIAALQASAGSRRTKLQAFTAHLWQLFAKAAAASPRQQPSCCMGVVVDGRGRLRADGAMKAYFGNVLTIPYGVMGTDTLSAMALADVADDVHRWVAEAATEEHFHDLVDWVEAHRPEPSVARAYLGGGEDAAACVVTSGLRLALGEVDFGWGRPAFASFHLPSPGGCGYVMPMPSVCRDGDWVVYVLAPPEVLELMEAEASVFRPLESSYVFG